MISEGVKIGGNGHNKLTLKQRLVQYLLKDAHIEELHIGAHSIVIDGSVIRMNPLTADPTSPAEGWLWHLAGTSHKPRFYDGTSLHDIGYGSTPGAHAATHQNGGADVIDLTSLGGEPATLTTHKGLATGVHGAGANTLEQTGNKGAASGYAPLGADSKVPDANSQVPSPHPAATTGVHGVGASTVESVSGSQSKVDTHNGLAAPHASATSVGGKTLPSGVIVGTTDTQELAGKTLNNAQIKDVATTPVGNVLLKALSGVLKARNAGDTADANMTVAQMSVGDVLFRNGWRLTEDKELGIVLVSPKSRKFRMVEC